MVALNDTPEIPVQAKTIPTAYQPRIFYDLERRLQVGDEILVADSSERGSHSELVFKTEDERVLTLDLVDKETLCIEMYVEEYDAGNKRGNLRQEIDTKTIKPGEENFDNLNQIYKELSKVKRTI